MAYREGTKNFHAEIDAAVKDAFKSQLKSRAQTQNDATTAALKLWMSMPHEFQSALISSQPDDIYKFTVEKLLDSDILAQLNEIGSEVKVDFLALLRQAKEKSSRKK